MRILRFRRPFVRIAALWASPLLVTLIASGAATLGLSGCDFLGGGSTEIDVAKPVALNPEADLFTVGSSRTFSLSEGIVRQGKDTTFAARTVVVSTSGDTLLGGTPRKRVEVVGSPAPAAVLAQLGLNPARLLVDTVALPDPGPGLRFPDSPRVGWSLDTTVGDLRHKRSLNKVETVRAAGLNQQCWVFTDSVYWGANPVAKEIWWMGARGLVKHRREWSGFAPAGITGGTLWRELKAAD